MDGYWSSRLLYRLGIFLQLDIISKIFNCELFLNRSSYSLITISRPSSASKYRMILVFVFSCSPISSLSSQSTPNSGCVFFFRLWVLAVFRYSFLFLLQPLLRFWILLDLLSRPRSFLSFFFISVGQITGGLIVTGEPTSMMNSFDCPWTNKIGFKKSTRLMPLTNWIWSISGYDSVLLSDVGASRTRFTVLDLKTLVKCPIFLRLLHCAPVTVLRFSAKAAISVWYLLLVGHSYLSLS